MTAVPTSTATATATVGPTPTPQPTAVGNVCAQGAKGPCDVWPGVSGDYCFNMGAGGGPFPNLWTPFCGDIANIRNAPKCYVGNTQQCGKMTVTGVKGIPIAGKLGDGQVLCYQKGTRQMIPCNR